MLDFKSISGVILKNLIEDLAVYLRFEIIQCCESSIWHKQRPKI